VRILNLETGARMFLSIIGHKVADSILKNPEYSKIYHQICLISMNLFSRV